MSYPLRIAYRVALLTLSLGGTSACGPNGPPPKVYVLSDGAAAEPAVESQLNKPTVEVRPVRVPDYLDTTDIVTRGAGGLIVPSESGRWGERFSIDLTRAVAAALARQLPRLAVTNSDRWTEPRWEVAIEVDAFDVRPSESSTLAATWSILDARHHRKLAAERVVLTYAGMFRTDAEVVAVMKRQVDELANRIATSLSPITRVPKPISTKSGSR